MEKRYCRKKQYNHKKIEMKTNNLIATHESKTEINTVP